MMIKLSDAVITNVAMSSSLRTPDKTSFAKLQSIDMVLIELQKITAILLMLNVPILLVNLVHDISLENLELRSLYLGGDDPRVNGTGEKHQSDNPDLGKAGNV